MKVVSRLSPQANAALERALQEPVVIDNGVPVSSPVQMTVNAPPPAADTEPRYLPPFSPWDQRLAMWAISQLFTPQRTLRFLRWFPWTYLQIRGFLRAWKFGRRVSRFAYEKRMAECGKCPGRVVRIKVIRHANGQPGWVGKEYCGKCGCPEWPLSELKRKNWMVGWLCPLRRHESTYGDETYRHLIASKGGCSSCGGGG